MLCTGAGPNIASGFESTGRCGDSRDIKITLVLGGRIKIHRRISDETLLLADTPQDFSERLALTGVLDEYDSMLAWTRNALPQHPPMGDKHEIFRLGSEGQPS